MGMDKLEPLLGANITAKCKLPLTQCGLVRSVVCGFRFPQLVYVHNLARCAANV